MIYFGDLKDFGQEMETFSLFGLGLFVFLDHTVISPGLFQTDALLPRNSSPLLLQIHSKDQSGGLEIKVVSQIPFRM